MEDIRQLPNSIIALWANLANVNASRHPTRYRLNKDILSFQRELEYIYISWFPKKNKLSDSQLSEYLFIREFNKSQIKNVFKARFFALIQTTQRLRKSIYSRWANEGFSQHVEDEIKLLKELAFEAAPFLDEVDYWVGDNKVYSGRRKRTVLDSKEIFEASKMIFRKAYYKSIVGDFAMRPTSIVLIRQAIELRIKNSIGIHMVRRKDGKIIRLPFSSLLIELLKRGDEGIRFPVSLLILRRIYDWSNYYIHSGWIPNIWEIENAHHLLKRLFDGKKSRNGSWSMYGTVRIKKSTYKAIPNILKNILKESNPNIDVEVIRLSRPECVII